MKKRVGYEIVVGFEFLRFWEENSERGGGRGEFGGKQGKRGEGGRGRKDVMLGAMWTSRKFGSGFMIE